VTIKAECSNPSCQTQVAVNTPAMNGWLQISQCVMFPQLGDGPPAQGDVCTIACAIEYLQSKQPRMEEFGERPTRDDGGTSHPPAEGEGGS
jgi:hypothetical protein